MKCHLVTLRGLRRACLPRHSFQRSLTHPRPIWTQLSRLVWGYSESNEAPGGTSSSPDRLHMMSDHCQKGAQTTRLTLAQMGRVLGINPQAPLPTGIENVVFVAIDCEAYEFAQNKTTEIGVSILDTALIANTPPGPNASTWLGKIKSEHFRVREFAHLVNKRWVKGDPDSFSFGSSTWIGKLEAKDVLTAMFSPPEPETRRNIVLVGHGVKNEVIYLKNLHFDLMNAPNVVGIVDTQSLGPTKAQIGLKKLCHAVGMEPQSLHNAGNDAAYTLRAMILATILNNSDPALYRAAFSSVVPARPAPLAAGGGAGAKKQRQTSDQTRLKPQQRSSSTSKHVEDVLNPVQNQGRARSISQAESILRSQRVKDGKAYERAGNALTTLTPAERDESSTGNGLS